MIDFDARILDPRDKPLPAGDGEEGDLTLRHIAERALLAPLPPELAKGLPGPHVRFKLWDRIKGGGKVAMKSEDVTMLKQVIEAAFPAPLIVGRALAALEPEAA